MATAELELIVDPELESYLPLCDAKTDEELERHLKETNGPLDSIKVWKGRNVIVDGYRRYRLSCKNGWDYNVEELEFANLAAVKYWMDRFQMSRRNLSAGDRAVLINRVMEYHKSLGMTVPKAAKKTASEMGLSERQVYRAQKHRENLESLDPTVRERIKSGNLNAKIQDVTDLATYSHQDQRNILAEFDAGEFKSIGEAIRGEGSDDDPDLDPTPAVEDDDIPFDEPKSPKSPQSITDTMSVKSKSATKTFDALGDAKAALGRLTKLIGDLDSVAGDAARFHACRSLMHQISTHLSHWGT